MITIPYAPPQNLMVHRITGTFSPVVGPFLSPGWGFPLIRYIGVFLPGLVCLCPPVGVLAQGTSSQGWLFVFVKERILHIIRTASEVIISLRLQHVFRSPCLTSVIGVPYCV